MAEIRVLSQAVADKIAAGEVAERPSAVVKELVENSIDAGADRITVEIKKGGISYILVEDNGKGIPFDEVETAFVRHATSKLREIDDLFEIYTMGFRGEALASICAVSDVTVITKQKDAAEGAHVTVNHGRISKKETVACNDGTVMVVENLFASVPARMKFLKKDSTEAGYVADVLNRIALSRPDIAFRYICDGKELFSTSGDGNLKNAILNIYGIDHAKGVLEVDHTEHGVSVTGVVGKAELSRGNRMRQTLFVNGRYIKNHVVSKIVEEAYRNVIMTGKFPFFVLDIKLSPSLVDVNVHPAKTEIKFANEKEVYDIVYHAVKNAIYRRESAAIESIPQQSENKTEPMKASYNPMPKPLSETQEKRTFSTPEQKHIAQFMESTVPKKAGGIVFREPEMPNPFEKLKTGQFDSELERKMQEMKAAVSKVSAEEKISEISTEGKSLLEDLSAEKTEKVQESLFDITEPEQKKDEAIRVVGQVFDTYVIAQQGEKMFLVDQHAAHERKRFEILKKDYEERGVSGQMLLEPIVLDVDSREIQVVKDNKNILENMGFEMEEFGRTSVLIRQTPFVSDEEDIKNLALEVISILSDGRPAGMLSFEERVLDTVSCKYAIKANKKLSALEMEVLLADVADLEKSGITTCPHGRPIKIEFSKREIEKMFKRIV